MSGIRKYRRAKPTQITRAKSPTRISLWDALLIVGVTMVLLGVFYGVVSYHAYTAGMHEHIENTKAGTIVVPEEAPGNPGRKASAIVGFATAGIGILLVIVSLEALETPGWRKRFSVRSHDIPSDSGDKGCQDENT